MTARVIRRGRWRLQRELARDRAATYYAAERATGEPATLCVPSDAWVVCEGAPRAFARVLALHRSVAAGFVRFIALDRDDHDEPFLVAEPVAPALHVLRGARPDPGQTRQLALEVTAALASIHARGIAHGELDLDHVLWAPGHAPRILGLGATLDNAALPGADALALGRVLCTLVARWPSQPAHTAADHRLRMLACRLADPASGLTLRDVHSALAADATTATPDPDATRDYDSASTLTSAPPVEVPLDDAQLGRYRIRARLGHGGMGEVMLAEDPTLRRGVAIKRIRPGFERDPTYRARLRREAQLAARLCHRAIVQVFDLITTDDVDHVVMEYVAGPSLATLLAGEPMPVPDAVRIAAELADGLDYAHRQGVLHRDLKLENVLIGPDGQAKIADFGIARRLPSSDIATLSAPLTRDNMTIGTARAMSPEQIQGGELDARSDLFSFGVLLYELLTGTSPFVSSVYLETFQRVLAHRPPPVRELVPSIPEALSALVACMLEKAPAARPRSAAEVRDRLRDCLASHTPMLARDTSREQPCIAPHLDAPTARVPARPTLAAKMQAPFILAEIRALRASVFKKAPEIQAALAIAEQIEQAHDLRRADLFLSALDTFCAILAPFATTVLTGTLRRIGYEIFPQYVSILGYAAPDVRRAMNLAVPTDLVRVICRAYNECVIGADAGTLAPTIAGATATVIDTTFMPCQLQMGVFLGAGLLTGLFREASLTERRCRARGDTACVYDFAF